MRQALPPRLGADVLVISGIVLGAILGPMKVRKLGGKPVDMLHYGAAYSMIGALLGLFATIIIHRMSA